MESTHHTEECRGPSMGCLLVSAGIMLSVVALFVNVTKRIWSSLWLPLWASMNTYWTSTKDGPMAQEQNGELNEEEARVTAELKRIMERVDKAPASSPERIHFIAESFEVLLECPSLLKKAPRLHSVTIQKSKEMRNTVRIMYDQDRSPIGITINDAFHKGETYVVAARRMMDMIDRLDVGTLSTPLPNEDRVDSLPL